MTKDVFDSLQWSERMPPIMEVNKLQVWLWRCRGPGEERDGYLGVPRHNRRANLTLSEARKVGTVERVAMIGYRAGHSDHHSDAQLFKLLLVDFFVRVWRHFVVTSRWSPLWESKSGKDGVGCRGPTTSSFEIGVWGRIRPRIIARFRVRRLFRWTRQHCR